MRPVGQHVFAPQTIRFQKQHEDWPRRSHVHQQRRVQYTGMGFGKHLSRPHMSRNVLVAPRISAHYIGPTPQHKPQRSHPLAGTQECLPFIVLLLPSTQILQQHRALGRIQPHKQRGGGPLRKIWLNLFSCGIDVKWSMCGGSCAGIVFEANITGGSATQYIHLPSGLSGLCNSMKVPQKMPLFRGGPVWPGGLLAAWRAGAGRDLCLPCMRSENAHPWEQDHHAPPPVLWLPP